MWLLYTALHVFFLSLVSYIDEYLTTNNKVPEDSDIHTKIGGLLLMTTLLSFLGAAVILIIAGDVWLDRIPLLLGLFSAVPLAISFAVYFYLLINHPIYQVVPLFLITSIWLLLVELLSGEIIAFWGIIGVLMVILGAYFLDAGTIKWQIPTKLLLMTLPGTIAWALAIFMVRIASENGSAVLISFWQFVGMGSVGVILFIFIKKYRNGLFLRVKSQGRNFIGFSIINESSSQTSFFFANLAIATAPAATYVSALGGAQGVFLLVLLFLFPIQKERAQFKRLEIIAIGIIAVGVFLIEGWG